MEAVRLSKKGLAPLPPASEAKAAWLRVDLIGN
jgi:hypothetical protein